MGEETGVRALKKQLVKKDKGESFLLKIWAHASFHSPANSRT